MTELTNPYLLESVAPRTALANYTLLNGLMLLAADVMALAFLGSTINSPMALLPLAVAFGAAGLYPGFGLPHAARLRCRWQVGGLTLGAVALVEQSLPILALGAVYLALCPLLEEVVRYALNLAGLWGRPVYVVGPPPACGDAKRSLLHQPCLGLRPVETQTPGMAVLLPAGAPVPLTPDLGAIFVTSKSGAIYALNAPRALMPRHNPQHLFWRSLKRTLDVAVGSTALLLTLPIMLLCMAVIYALDPGPVIFGQVRRGQHGKPVKIYKLRSMALGSEAKLSAVLQSPAHAAEWARSHKLQSDPRLLPLIGRFMRRFSIDELPQLWNVLKGEMSLVGPRIFVDYDLAAYPPAALALRQNVRPGLTGLWQVTVRSGGDNRDKVRYDSAYILGWSFWQEISILYRTLGAVFSGRGAV